MDSIAFIRQMMTAQHGFLEGTMDGVTAEHAHWTGGNKANPIGATYAHVVVSEDSIINGMLRGQAPLAMSTWAGKTGLSEPMPMPGGDWEHAYGDWARRVQVDLPALHAYAQAVYAASDGYLATLTPESLDQPIDLAAMGMGTMDLGWVLGQFVVGHIANITGEISALKGVQGQKGYPF